MKILHQFLKGISLTGALFVFQACYGIKQPYYETGEAPMDFLITSNADGTPLEGVHIKSRPYNSQYVASYELGVTGPDGRCKVSIPYERNSVGPIITFQDPAGNYADKDTTLADLREREIVVKLYPQL